MIKKTLIAMMVCLMMVGVSSAKTINEIELPETLMAGDTLLLLNGGGTRVAFMNDVYVAGLWLTRPMTDPAEIKMADEPMAIRMHVTNDFFASSKNINKAFNNGFRNAMPSGNLTPIQDKVDRFKACWGDKITDGDEFDIVYIPKKGVSVYKNGQLKDTVEGYEFKQAVWSIWLHDTRPADEDLKAGMIEGKFSAGALQAKEQFMANAKRTADKAAIEAAAAKEAAMKAAEEAKAAAEAKAAEEAAMTAAAETEAKAAKEEVKVAAAEAKTKAVAETKAAKKEVKVAATEAKAAVAAGTAAVAVSGVSKTADEATQAAAAASRVEGPLTRDNFSAEEVFFGSNSAALTADAKTTLQKKALWMKSNPAVTVAVEVYCDARGSAALNNALAEKRGQSVVDFMTESGIDASRMEVVVKGAVESAATHSAFANNRRAHFTIK